MSRQAVEYVRSRQLANQDAARVFMLLAECTASLSGDVMGLELHDADVPGLAARIGIGAQEFRRLLRLLRTMVPMDVLEHDDGVWEIVYGPTYTNPKRAAAPQREFDETQIDGINAFSMPGWDHYSTWGYEHGLGHFYAQLFHNSDDRDGRPRIWITPPRYFVTTLDELAAAIAEAIAPYEVVPPPPAIVKSWMMD